MLCKKCGSTIEEKNSSCPKCGEINQPKPAPVAVESVNNIVIPILIIIVLIAIISLVSYYVIAKDHKPAAIEPEAQPQQINLTNLTQEVEKIEEVELIMEVEEVGANLIEIDLNSPLVEDITEYIDLLKNSTVSFLSEFDDISQIDTKVLISQILVNFPEEYNFKNDYFHKSKFGIENYIHSFINEDVNFTDVDYLEVELPPSYIQWNEEEQSFSPFEGCFSTSDYYRYEIKSVLQDEENNLIHIDLIEYLEYIENSGLGDIGDDERIYYFGFESQNHEYDENYVIGLRTYFSQEIEFNEKYDELPICRYTITPSNSGFKLLSKTIN